MPQKKKSKRHTHAGRKIVLFLIILAILAGLFIYFAPPPSEPKPVTVGDVTFIEGLEVPQAVKGEQQIAHTGYLLSYNEEAEQPSWVAYQLTRDEVNGSISRADNFRIDPAVITGSATLDDYRGSGYDRGHLCPAADQKWSAQAMDDSFYLSNMSPQTGAFNRGIWGSLESVVRTFANDFGAIYIATGPVLSDGPYKTIGKSKVTVPKEYYKVVLFFDGTNAQAIGFLLKNEGSDKKVRDFAVTVDQVEEKTGLDFFPALDDQVENKVEATCDTDQWDWKEFHPGDDAKMLVETKEPDTSKQESVKQIILVVCQELRKTFFSWVKTL